MHAHNRQFFQLIQSNPRVKQETIATCMQLAEAEWRQETKEVGGEGESNRKRLSDKTDLHNESFEADIFEGVRVVVVEFQIVMEDEAALHAGRHSDANRDGTFLIEEIMIQNETRPSSFLQYAPVFLPPRPRRSPPPHRPPRPTPPSPPTTYFKEPAQDKFSRS